MEEADDLMTLKCPRRLNFDAPILSTRRRISDFLRENSDNDHQWPRSSCDTCESKVPFSWEQVPGTPKATIITPRIPPRWCCSPNGTDGGGGGPGGGGGSSTGDNGYIDMLSDKLDMFSLSESVDISTENKNRRLNSLDVELMEANRKQSPSFIIKRFLPDATALAYFYSSGLTSQDLQKKVQSEAKAPYSQGNLQKSRSRSVTVECTIPRLAGKSYSPQKACGIQHFFPWRKKHNPCGLKSPVRIVRGSSPKVKPNGHTRAL